MVVQPVLWAGKFLLRKTNMDWRRINDISKPEYDNAFKDADKKEKAYKEASEVRKFEIKLYWERTKYFWAFITTIYVAYYHVYLNVCDKQNGTLPLLVLAGLGFIFSLAWVLVNLGSRHWQENWENHMDLLEDNVTGPLYKIYKSNVSFSVSRINLYLSYVVCICALVFCIFEIAEFCKSLKSISKILFFGILILFTVTGGLAFIFYTKGNTTNKGNITFDKKFYV